MKCAVIFLLHLCIPYLDYDQIGYTVNLNKTEVQEIMMIYIKNLEKILLIK